MMRFSDQKLRILFFRTPGNAAPNVITGFYDAAVNSIEIKNAGYQIFIVDIKSTDDTSEKVANILIKSLVEFNPNVVIFYGFFYLSPEGTLDIISFLNNKNIVTCGLWYDDCYKFIKQLNDKSIAVDSLKKLYNNIFVSDRIWKEELKTAENIEACLLRLAFNDVSTPLRNIPDKYDYDISFIGIIDQKRFDLLSGINKKYKIDIWGQAPAEILNRFPKNMIFHGRADYVDEAPVIYNTSKINLNFSMPQLITAVSQRIYDIPGNGGFVLPDFKEDLYEIFGDNAVFFMDNEDLNKKIDFYLNNENHRIQYIHYSQNIIRNYHTYLIRFSEILYFLDKKYLAI